jgi:hypothetical protein
MTDGCWKSCFRPRRVLLTLVVAGCVLGLTHIPGQDIPRVLQNVAPDKVEHIVAYGLMAGSFLLSLRRPVRLVWLLLGVAALAVLGALDETTQPLVNRTCDLWDYVSDLTGITIACATLVIGGLLKSRAIAP